MYIYMYIKISVYIYIYINMYIYCFFSGALGVRISALLFRKIREKNEASSGFGLPAGWLLCHACHLYDPIRLI